MNKTLKIALIVTGIVLSVLGVCVILIGNAIYFSSVFDEKIEDVYAENKQLFERFNELCFENSIEFIGRNEHLNLTTDHYQMIEDYYVYSPEEIDNKTVEELTILLKLFNSSKIHSIYINLEEEHVGYAAEYFLANVMLVYSNENKSIDEIESASFCQEVKYIDEKWYLEID